MNQPKQVKEVRISQQDDGSFRAAVSFDDGSGNVKSGLSFDEATQYVDYEAYHQTDIPEQPASDITEAEAQQINAQVVPPTPPHGAESIESGAGHTREGEDDESTDGGQKEAQEGSE